jgi:hypothetical protein
MINTLDRKRLAVEGKRRHTTALLSRRYSGEFTANRD